MKNSRLFGLLTIFCALLAVLILTNPTEAQAATVASGTCGENLTWTLDDEGVLRISGAGPMYNYKSDWYDFIVGFESFSRSGWWYFNSQISKVIISEGVTTVGDNAFCDCTGLTSVTIPDSVTIIGDLSFFKCSGLASVTIPDGVTSIGYFGFANCTGLTTIIIPDNVTTIDACAFLNCSGLTSVTVGDSVTSICESAFKNCTNLKSVTYCGTKAQWNSISIEPDNSELTSATRYYHNFSEATCLSPKTCSICGTTEGTLADHRGDYWTEILKPTCTAEGMKSRICECCGVTETVAIPATGHSYSAKVTKPTCTEQGYTTFTCSCGDSYIGKYVQATGHSGSWVDLVPASCTEGGIHARVCQVCSTMETENVPASGHSYDSVVTAPTCTTQGYTTKTCSACGNVEVTNYVSAKGHSWNPWITVKAATCTVEGAQMRFCNCGTTESQTIGKLPHSYADGVCSACGAAEAVEIEKFDIDASRMILGNALEFQFGVAMDKIPCTTGYYAVIEKTWADGSTTTKTIPAEEWGTVGTYWAIGYDGLAAKEMSDIFYVTVYNADGAAVSNAKTDSVRDYVMRNIDKSSDILKTLMVNMLDYGAAAQVTFSYGTNDLANNQLTDEQKALGTATLEPLTNGQQKGDFYLGTRLVLKSRIQLQVAFAGLTRDMYAIYTFTNNRGELQTERVEGSEFVDAGGVLGVEMNKLKYSTARAMVNVAVYYADGTIYGTASDSIEGYVQRNAKSDTDVAIALMKFADSAKAYLYG